MAKGPEAFRTISEASLELGVAQHVLRFWETRFSFIRPLKRAGGRRFYRPRDIAILATVRRLLHQEGYSIKAVQTLHREKGVNHLAAGSAGNAHAVEAIPGPAMDGDRVRRLRASLAALEAAKARLDSLLAGR
ncbi:MAG: MerR family transcriptional regulator [Pseudomonadota bacterium]